MNTRQPLLPISDQIAKLLVRRRKFKAAARRYSRMRKWAGEVYKMRIRKRKEYTRAYENYYATKAEYEAADDLLKSLSQKLWEKHSEFAQIK